MDGVDKALWTYLFVLGFLGASLFSMLLMLSGFCPDGSPQHFETSRVESTRRQIGDDWPTAVNVNDVESIEYDSTSSPDTFCAWYRIQLDVKTAATWVASAHARTRQSAVNSADPETIVEGVERTRIGPPQLRYYRIAAPRWWLPPNIAFNSTEVMIWPATSASGSCMSYGTFSAYDQRSATLWLIEHRTRHKKLWKMGSPPDVPEQFGRTPEHTEATAEHR